MSNNGKSDSNNRYNPKSGIIIFHVTENMKNIGIKDFILNKFNFEITLISGRKCCVAFSPKKSSITEHSKSIEKKLYEDANVTTEGQKAFGTAIADIENQLIEHRNKIFCASNHDGSGNNSVIRTYNENTQKILEQIKALRQQVKESKVTVDEWRAKLIEKYDHLRKLTLQSLPELWLPLEFVISTKSIINIKGWTLPFMAVLLVPPSSMKTIALDILIDYPHTYTTDEFTPSSFVSHNSALTEKQLQKVDMLPKMVDNLCTFPELAPLFTAKEEDLQRNFGKILRILDGKGFQSDSGAQGHRGYSGDMMFTIVGAAVEIQYRVYKMFGNLGQKIYYLRLPRIEKSREERKKAAKQKNDFKDKIRQIKGTLFDYLMWFDAAPDCSAGEIDSKSGLVKIEWDVKKKMKMNQILQ